MEDFSEPVPGLFQALTAEPDPHERWLTFTYPVDFDMSLFAPKQEKEIKYHMRECPIRKLFHLTIVPLKKFLFEDRRKEKKKRERKEKNERKQKSKKQKRKNIVKTCNT